jgi:glycine cleavage system aminomethyltransferase T
LDSAIAFAYVYKSLSKIEQALEIEIRGKTYPATVDWLIISTNNVIKRKNYRSYLRAQALHP